MELANTSSDSLQRKLDHNGPTWTKEDQEGPRWWNVQRLLIVRSVHSVQSSPRPPPKKLPCSRWSALKIILVIVIVVFSFFNDNLNRYDLETFEHLRSSPGLPCNVPSAGSRFASCLYVHTWPSTMKTGKETKSAKIKLTWWERRIYNWTTLPCCSGAVPSLVSGLSASVGHKPGRCAVKN